MLCRLRRPDCTEPFGSALKELGHRATAKNVWMLLRPTLTIMLLASVVVLGPADVDPLAGAALGSDTRCAWASSA